MHADAKADISRLTREIDNEEIIGRNFLEISETCSGKRKFLRRGKYIYLKVTTCPH